MPFSWHVNALLIPHDLFSICSWLLHYICPWLVHNLSTTFWPFLCLFHDLFMTCLCSVHNSFMTCLYLAQNLLKLRSWFVCDELSKPCSWLAYKLFTTCSQLIHELNMICPWLTCDMFKTWSCVVHILFAIWS